MLLMELSLIVVNNFKEKVNSDCIKVQKSDGIKVVTKMALNYIQHLFCILALMKMLHISHSQENLFSSKCLF